MSVASSGSHYSGKRFNTVRQELPGGLAFWFPFRRT